MFNVIIVGPGSIGGVGACCSGESSFPGIIFCSGLSCPVGGSPLSGSSVWFGSMFSPVLSFCFGGVELSFTSLCFVS